jgi:hypothetical protein
MESETKILALVEDMAEMLQNIAVNKCHTPHLYSVFLRALLASKLEGSRPNSPPPTTSTGPVISANDSAMMTNLPYPQGPESPPRSGFVSSNDVGLEMYKSLGENYGDVTGFVNPFDMSAQTQNTSGIGDVSGHFDAGSLGMDTNAPMSLDSFLSTGFWDSMLVPGAITSRSLAFNLDLDK